MDGLSNNCFSFSNTSTASSITNPYGYRSLKKNWFVGAHELNLWLHEIEVPSLYSTEKGLPLPNQWQQVCIHKCVLIIRIGFFARWALSLS